MAARFSASDWHASLGESDPPKSARGSTAGEERTALSELLDRAKRSREFGITRATAEAIMRTRRIESYGPG